MNLPENATRDSGTQVAAEQPAGQKHAKVAPILHTLVLIVIILAFSLLGSSRQQRVSTAHGRVILYSGTIVWEWLMVGYIILGIRRRGLKLRDLIRGRWTSAGKFFADIGIAIGFWITAMFVLGAVGYLLGMASPSAAAEAKQKIGFLVPRSLLELALFLGVSATAGFCEEVIFRGYLQRQFEAVTKSAVAGIVLQAIIFGAGHGYEGAPRMILIAVFGAMFGILAYWRKSLRPGMIAHGMHDSIQGIALYASKFLEKIR
jgi:membrane protease YdiL (CAAX protease family)